MLHPYDIANCRDKLLRPGQTLTLATMVAYSESDRVYANRFAFGDNTMMPGKGPSAVRYRILPPKGEPRRAAHRWGSFDADELF